MRVLGLCYDVRGRLRKKFAALDLYASEIREACAADVSTAGATTLPEAEQVLSKHKPDVLFLCPEWHTPYNEVESLIAAVRGAGISKLVFVDYCDGTSTPFLGLLPRVDLFIKAHCLSDTKAYERTYEGGHIFSDFLSREMGWDLGGWSLGSTLDPAQSHKLVPGWTWVVANRYQRLTRSGARLSMPWSLRRIDINTRFGGAGGGEDWYRQYRKLAFDKAHELSGQARLSSSKRVGLRRYLVEMGFTRLALSPFGWGEVCYRDFEAIAFGALLVKPDMSHLQTHPDLYRPFETYVPVKWDLSDLHEKCTHYLKNPRESRQIARQAQQTLQWYFREKQFVRQFGSYLERLVGSRD